VTEEWGLVAFAADLFGKEYYEMKLWENRTSAAHVPALFRNNIDLYQRRVRAAVEVVRGFEEVDASQVFVGGSCLGGTSTTITASTSGSRRRNVPRGCYRRGAGKVSSAGGKTSARATSKERLATS